MDLAVATLAQRDDVEWHRVVEVMAHEGRGVAAVLAVRPDRNVSLGERPGVHLLLTGDRYGFRDAPPRRVAMPLPLDSVLVAY